MKKAIFLLSGTLLLTACSGSSSSQSTLEDRMKNPLFAEQYAEMLVDRMVELEIDKSPILEIEAKKKIVDETRRSWLELARKARTKQREGIRGVFIGIEEFTQGEGLYVDNTFYTGPTFEVDPGEELHVYLTTAVDPRDINFPDDTAIDLGPLNNPFGTNTIPVPSIENSELIRTVVIWDQNLERIYGFAQLAK